MVRGKAAVFITAHAGCVSRPSVSHGLRRASDNALCGVEFFVYFTKVYIFAAPSSGGFGNFKYNYL